MNSFIGNQAANALNTTKNALAPIVAPVAPLGTAVKNAFSPVAPLGTAVLNRAKSSINATPSSSSTAIIATFVILGIILVLLIWWRDQIGAWFAKVGAAFRGAGQRTAGAVERAESAMGADVERVVPPRKQVFNVSSNKYTYSDAEPLCKALGAELATYDQVLDAWKHGADWCNYGWVKGQGALYPTQQATFDKLQDGDSDDERLACGQVGVNGGYFDNPDLRFGVNCYGNKPAENTHDWKSQLRTPYPPQTPDVIEATKKELRYKHHAGETVLNPFKPGQWSE